MREEEDVREKRREEGGVGGRGQGESGERGWKEEREGTGWERGGKEPIMDKAEGRKRGLFNLPLAYDILC